MFKTRSEELPPSGAVRDTLRGLIKRWIGRHGIEALRTRRVEPVTTVIIEKVVVLLHVGTAIVRGIVWMAANWTAFIITAWMVINLSVGSRKGESTKLPGDTGSQDWFTRRSLTWQIAGRIVTEPTSAQLDGLQPGRDRARLAPKGAKCDVFGTAHGTEPIILPYHDKTLNAAKWLAMIERRWPAHGPERDSLPLFCDESGEVFSDSTFAALIMAALTAVLGPERAKLFSPHSWRVWLASALRMVDAPDPLIQALGRWLNPESIKIYARLGVQEYGHWVDKLMTVRHIDATRTTNLPAMEQADVLRPWWEHLGGAEEQRGGRYPISDTFDAAATSAAASPSPPLSRGQRISVFWTEMDAWYDGTVTSSRVERADDGSSQRATHINYDPTGPWRTAQQLSHWHCLDDENWRAIE